MRHRSGFGWLEFIAGILLILLGGFTFFCPSRALGGLVALYGIIAVIVGIGDILLYIRMERFVGFGPIVALISGILSVMSGFMLLVYPRAGELVLSLLFPIWFIAHCISRLSHLNLLRLRAGNAVYWITLVLNIAGLLLGILMLVDPVLSLFSSAMVVSLYLILLGVDSISLAFSDMGC